jgi:hypothetical protein
MKPFLPCAVLIAFAPHPFAASFHVSTQGSDENPGTRRKPFASMERARDEIRRQTEDGKRPGDSFEVIVRGGVYPVGRAFTLDAIDSGTEAAPVVYRAEPGEHPVFSGGRTLRHFEPVTDAALLDRIPPSARGRVIQTSLDRTGVTNLLPFALGGFASGRGFRTHPAIDLFIDGKPMPLARSSATMAFEIGGLSDPEKEPWHGKIRSVTGRFTCEREIPAGWAREPDLWLFGYWFFGWADSYEKVASINMASREITLAPPFSTYGFRAGVPFHALNALCELDEPGEWYLDRERKLVLLFPPPNAGESRIELSTAPFLFLELNNVSNVRIEGLTFDMGCADAIRSHGGTNVLLAGLTVRRFAGNGMEIGEGRNQRVLSCDIHTMGRGGILMGGGDRKTLQPGGHSIENCEIYNLSRIDRTYTPAVLVSGVGHRITHNWFHHIPSSALRVGGNDHLVDLNEISHVVLESDDQGAVDMWGDPTGLGITYRGNFFHHIGGWRTNDHQVEHGQAAIRLDDAISGVTIERNLFFRVGSGRHGFGAVQIHGGKDNVVATNLFVDCRWGVSFSPWPAAHWNTFTEPMLKSAGIDPSLYAARYPEFKRMHTNLNVNFLRGNVLVNCGSFLHRDQFSRLDGNTESPVSLPGLAEAIENRDDRALRNAVERLHAQPPALSQIGLGDDKYRKVKARDSR